MNMSAGGPQDAARTVGERMPFHAHAVAKAPASPGVYLLYCRHHLIYIGRAADGATIRQCLERHLRGQRGRCTRVATEFDYEASTKPVALYRHYLAVYLGATGGVLPDCSETDDRRDCGRRRARRRRLLKRL